MSRWTVGFTDKQQAEFERLRALLDETTGSKVVVSAIRFTLALLDKQKEGYTICLKKDGEVTDLKFLF